MKPIPKSQLVTFRWYVGRGRNANVGFWDGERFLTVGQRGPDWVVKREPYLEAETGCFQPFRMVDEGVVTVPWDHGPGWNRHYAREMEFKGD